jgi:hypothetical protein
VGLVVFFRTTSIGTAPSETKALSEAAQARAQFQEGKRLLDRLEDRSKLAATAPASAPTAPPDPLSQTAAAQATPQPIASGISAGATPAPEAAPSLTVPEREPSEPRGLLAALRQRVHDIAKGPPSTPVTVATAEPPLRPSPELTPPLARGHFAAISPIMPMQPQVEAPPLPPPPVLAFVLRPFDAVALAHFRRSEHDLSPIPQPISMPVPEPVAVVAAPAAGSGAAPSFGSVDPVPMAAEIARKSAKQGPVNCVAIIEQAQLGELTAEDRTILKTKCR